MRGKLQRLALIALGACLGAMISLNFSAVAQREAAPSPLPVEELRALTDVFALVKNEYVDQVEDKKLISGAIAGMLAGLDPHSAYLDKDAFRDFQIGTHGEFGGLGIEMSMEDGLLKVISPIDDTPAAHAGIRPGDVIVKIDDTLAQGMTINDAVKRMRGTPNTKITLTIVRQNAPKPVVVTLTRAIIRIQSVKSTLLEPGYAYLRITQFQENTGEALASAIQNLFKQNQAPMKGITLDLRNDPGGLLNSAIAAAAAFLPRDSLVVYTEGRTAEAQMHLTASPENYLRSSLSRDYLAKLPPDIKKVPIVVLVNAGTASAAEIVAGALQDYQRAVIMGSTTFGKGSVQTILPVGDDTAIMLTTARYYTPKGRSIQAKGIVPDIALDDQTKASDATLVLREADFEKHLTGDRGKDDQAAAPVPATNFFNFTPAPRPKQADENDTRPKPGEVVAKGDYELAQALAFLKSRDP